MGDGDLLVRLLELLPPSSYCCLKLWPQPLNERRLRPRYGQASLLKLGLQVCDLHIVQLVEK